MPYQKIISLLFCFGFFCFFGNGTAVAQCDATVPNFIVDLSNNPDSAWISSSVFRAGNCCGTTPPDVCVSFTLTLAPTAKGILFDVCSGAIPGGALFYQLGCGPQRPVGELICLTGAGPHLITFCKPGNNQNQYCITSISEPKAGVDLQVNDGCVDTLSTLGFSDTSIVWNSVFPGIRGAYNNLLSCTQDCPTTVVTGVSGAPSFIDYEVCGYPIGGCGFNWVCDTVRVTFFSTLDVNILPENPTICFGSTSTSISANATGGNPPYNYLWSTNQTTQSINVGVGTYTVEVNDGSGCPPTFDTVTVTSFANPIQANAGNDTVLCDQNSVAFLNGSVIAASGGVWLGGNGNFSPNDSDLNATYTPTAAEISTGFLDLILETTGNGTCPADRDTVRITFSEFSATILTNVDSVSCIGGSDGSVQLNVSGALSPYTFQWDANAGSSTSSSAINLSEGSYSVTITDNLGCDSIVNIQVYEPDSLLSSISSNIPASCFGRNDGQATVTATGGTAPYTYLWSDNQTTSSAINLAAGFYLVTVTDANGCTKVDTTTITQPLLLSSSVGSSTNVSCFGGNDGSATASATGGTAPFSYLWSNNAPTANITNLTAGTYIVTVTDDNACTDTSSVTVTEPTDLTTSITINQNALCAGSIDGSATVTANGGTSPYTYLWSNSQNTATATSLAAGTYFVTVTDANLCIALDTISITEPSVLTSSFSSVTNVSCYNGNDGSVVINVSGGTPTFQYQWSSGSLTNTESNLSAGTYTVTVTDNNLCEIIDTIQITEPDSITTNISSNIPASCFGGNDGQATVTATGGTGAFIYLWSNNQTTSTAINLAAGFYSVTVTDVNGCTKVDTTTITQPLLLSSSVGSSTNVSCFGGSDGSATASATGGTAPFTYLWSNNETTASISSLTAGTYTVTVTDDNGCTAVSSVNITEPFALTSATNVVQNALCAGSSTGSATVLANGGTSPYTYIWSNSQTSATATSLAAGTYFVTVTDANSCISLDTVTITEPTALNSNFSSVTHVSCYGGNNGSASVTVTGGISPFQYQWSSGSLTNSTINLSAGTYTVTITDFNQCVLIDTIQITQPDSLESSFSQFSNVSCNLGNDGSATINPVGGTSPYSYVWSNNQVTQQAQNLVAGTYSVTITDSKGCLATNSINISEPAPLTINVSSSIDTVCLNQTVQLVATANGGTGSYNYQWNHGMGNSPSHLVTPTTTTTYIVSVKDQNNCQSPSDTLQIVVRNIFEDSISVIADQEICPGEAAKLSGFHNGTYGPYNYTWSNTSFTGIGPHTVYPTSTTTYILRATDSKCNTFIEDSLTVTLLSAPPINLPGTIKTGCAPLTVLFDNNTGNEYRYKWNFGNGQTSTSSKPSYTFLNSGTYYVTLEIESFNGCKTTSSNQHKVIVHPSPNADFTVAPPKTTLESPTINFKSDFTDAFNWLWKLGDGDSTDEQTFKHTYSDTGSYVVELWKINQYGCTDTVRKIVYVGPVYTVGIPNAFTPDPTGPSGGRYNPNSYNNNIFFPFTQYVEDFHMLIFNRWGEVVFESNDYSIGWDGYYKDKLCQQDVYVYKIEIRYTDGEEIVKVGDVTLLR